MDTSTLTEALRALNPESFSWKFALYNVHKTQDGPELDWNLCAMKGIHVQVDKMREFLLKKPVSEKTVSVYTPFLSDKENIGALKREDEIIQEQITDMILNIQNADEYAAEDFLNGTVSKTTGFAYYGEIVDENEELKKQVVFMRRSNPFLNSTASQLYINSENEIVSCNKPVLKFTTATDFVMIDGVCYFFSSAIEKDFALENRHYVIAARHMEKIAEVEIVGDYEWLEHNVMTPKNARKFLDFDKKILDRIVRLSIVDREEFLNTYGVNIDKNGRIDTSDAEQCDLIIDLLCCRSCIDPLGRLVVGSNITPRE